MTSRSPEPHGAGSVGEVTSVCADEAAPATVDSGMATKRLLVATGVSVLLLAGCATGSDSAPPAAPSASKPAASVSTEATALLSRYGLEGKSAVQIVDHLDRLGPQERPADLMASVRPGELVLSRGAERSVLALPEERFYLSVAPFVQQTHECFYHSLTTCKGELAAKDVQVRIVDETTGRVLVDGAQTTFENGFVGFWLPRGMHGTLEVTADGKAGQTKISTDNTAPTCLTTVQLV